jgi:DNA-binding GntR family transcriptional regulator
VEIAVDVTSAEYPYMQIARQIRDKIANGEYVDRVPSLKELIAEIKPRPAYNTVRRAIAVLKDEGLIVTAPGRGTFVKRQAG